VYGPCAGLAKRRGTVLPDDRTGPFISHMYIYFLQISMAGQDGVELTSRFDVNTWLMLLNEYR
jgi:hypothetical protein